MDVLQHILISLIPFLFFIIFLHKLRSKSRKTLPPSPRKLPIIGNLHQLGIYPHRSLYSLSKHYGPLMLLHFGRVPVFVASSANAAREIMKNQELIFSSRPKLSIPDWTMAELIKNSKTMKIFQDEVREVVEGKEEITDDDLDKMSYLKAVIKESLRLHSPVSTLVFRQSTQDTRVLGFDIEGGTKVLINAWAIARDLTLWENPEKFNLERFVDSNMDFRGLNFEFIPFGIGRRRCPGITFAMTVNELLLAKLVHNFNFDLPNGGRQEDLDMSEATE